MIHSHKVAKEFFSFFFWWNLLLSFILFVKKKKLFLNLYSFLPIFIGLGIFLKFSFPYFLMHTDLMVWLLYSNAWFWFWLRWVFCCKYLLLIGKQFYFTCYCFISFFIETVNLDYFSQIIKFINFMIFPYFILTCLEVFLMMFVIKCIFLNDIFSPFSVIYFLWFTCSADVMRFFPAKARQLIPNSSNFRPNFIWWGVPIYFIFFSPFSYYFL